MGVYLQEYSIDTGILQTQVNLRCALMQSWYEELPTCYIKHH